MHALMYSLTGLADTDDAALSAGNLTIYLFQTDAGEHAPRRTTRPALCGT